MKKLLDLKSVVSEDRKYLIKEGKNIGKLKVKRISKKIKFYSEMIKYLETEPKEEFVVSEIKRLKKIINSKNSQYENWSENVCPTDVPLVKKRALFNKENDIPRLKTQLKNLQFLIED